MIPAKIPTETASLEPARISAVIEPVTPSMSTRCLKPNTLRLFEFLKTFVAFFAVCSRRIVAVRCREHLPFSVDWRFRDCSSLKNGLSAGPAQAGPIGVED
jgi:hypothetical protein